MTAIAVPQDYIPVDDADLARHYGALIRNFVRKQGVPAQDVDDASQFILMRLHERGVLGMYEPGKGTFRNFLYAQIALYAKGQRDKVLRRQGHEFLVGGTGDGEGDNGTPWLEVLSGGVWDDYSHIDAGEFVTRMRAYLATVPLRSADDACDLVALFDELVREVRERGECSRSAVAERFNVGATTAGAWIRRLREIMTEAQGGVVAAPVPHEVGGLTLSMAEIRDAIEILRASKGNMVKQPLARAGHRLGIAPDPRWYHSFSAAEREQYPEVATDAGSHKRPADHVKRAVIHRLERMLGIALADSPAPPDVVAIEPEPEPEPVTGKDVLEGALWRITGITPEQVDHILATADWKVLSGIS